MLKSDAGNALLERLSIAQRTSFIGSCELFDLTLDADLCEVDELIQYVYFPLAGLISLSVTVPDRPPLNVSFVGCEGMLGVGLALGIKSAPTDGIVRGIGSAYRMKASKFTRMLTLNSDLRQIMGEYVANLLFTLSLNAACIHFHEVGPRLARCLLDIHDRANSDDFKVTHQSLAGMLGVQRRAVTSEAGLLKAQGLIRYSRGDVSVVDRTGLERAACKCFQTASDHDDHAYG
jgi:CRP-like cAMP-binding protein